MVSFKVFFCFIFFFLTFFFLPFSLLSFFRFYFFDFLRFEFGIGCKKSLLLHSNLLIQPHKTVMKSTIKFVIWWQTHGCEHNFNETLQNDKMGIVFRSYGQLGKREILSYSPNHNTVILVVVVVVVVVLSSMCTIRVNEGDDKNDQTTCIGIGH